MEALVHSLESPPNVICLTETWLTENDDIDSLLVPGYNNYAIKNRNTLGGGVMIQIKDPIFLLETHSTDLDETLLVSLQYNKYRFKLATIYNPPRTNKLKFVEKLDKFLNDLTSINCPTVMAGDFNIDTHVKNQLHSNYLCTISANDFEIANLETTRETSTSATCLDHFIFTEQNYLPFRDISFIKDQEKRSKYLTDLDWNLRNRCHFFESDSTNDLFDKFNSLFLEITNKYALLKCLAHKKSKLPKWFTNTLKNLRFKKNQAHRSMKQNPHNNEAAKKNSNCYATSLESVKKAKTDFYAQKFESCIGDSRQTYKLLKDIKGTTRKSSQVPALNSCNARCTDPSSADIAEEFNTFFTNVGPKLKYNIKRVPLTKMDEVNHSMYLKPITCDEVREIIDNLDNKFSSGDDDISNVIVKLSSNVTIPYLTQIINLSFEEGIFPDDLKKAKVIPLHKDGSKLDENNYRPISLLIVWSKIIERALFIRIYAYMEYHNLFFNRQFGFRTKHSTIDALVELVEKIRLNCRNVKAISFYLDLKKAFDTTEHDILLKKIENTGIRGPALSWVTTYLKGRQQRVIVNGACSSRNSIVCGVPQGSILGPLLFLIYINDLPLVCKSLDVILFADDTNLTAIKRR